MLDKTVFEASDASIRCLAILFGLVILVTLNRASALPKTFVGVQIGCAVAMMMYSAAALVLGSLHSALFSEQQRPLAFDNFLLNTSFFVDGLLYTILSCLETFLRLESHQFRMVSKYKTVTVCMLINIVLKASLATALIRLTPFDLGNIPRFVELAESVQLWVLIGYVVFVLSIATVVGVLFNYQIKQDSNSKGFVSNTEYGRLIESRQLFFFHVLPYALVLIAVFTIHLLLVHRLNDFEQSTTFTSLFYATCPILFTIIHGLGTRKLRCTFLTTLKFWKEYRETVTKVRPFHADRSEVAVSQLYAIGVL
ncbi:hypothetical protein QR680_003934 [Steinernema hermaphroditum]|uniref:Uncharacterized protein n=1 Tax=Steinernema hermaphroditum TaxID=289476 RepID=A0AA39HPC3_9BILA|nr:hypothetical protein QR680_003934 [Steinernema hermaphroditum]